MKIKVIAMLMVTGCILFIQSCATTPTMPTTELAAVASREQKTADDGTITSRKKHVVSLSPYAELGSGSAQFDLAKYRTLFMLSVENCSKEPISIGFDNISVIFEDKSKDPALKKISIQPFSDFMADYKTLYNEKEKVFIYDRAYPLYLTTLECQRPLGWCPPLSWWQTRMAFIKENISKGRAEMDAIQMMLPGYTLEQKTLIEPGNSIGGIVICDTHDLDHQLEGRFLIIVFLDGEEYNFTFNRSITN